MCAINTRLTESHSFPIAGWETEVGPAGCLNDSVSRPAGLGVSRLGRTLAIYKPGAWPCIASACFTEQDSRQGDKDRARHVASSEVIMLDLNSGSATSVM